MRRLAAIILYLYVLPYSAVTDRRYDASCDSKSSRKSYTFLLGLQYLYDIFFGQLCCVVVAATLPILCVREMIWGSRRWRVPALLNTVLRVIFRCSYEQVIWPSAFRIVALVKGEESLGNRPGIAFIREAVRKNFLSFPLVIAGSVQKAITGWVPNTEPNPTANLSFENQRIKLAYHGAELLSAPWALIRRAAYFARADHCRLSGSIVYRTVALCAAFATMILPIQLALAQGSVVLQSGQISPGHVAQWGANGVIYDGGAALGGPVGTNPFEIGITNTGTPFCVTDVPITSPYHQLCFGANTLAGYGVLSFNYYGGAQPLPFDCIINFQFIPNCFGGGSVTSISVTANPCIIATPNPITSVGTISTNIPYTVPCGGTGQVTFTANNPLIGNGINGLLQGTRHGNTVDFATVTGTTTNLDCAVWDGNGNLKDVGACPGGGGGGITSLTIGEPVEFLTNGSGSAVTCTSASCTFTVTKATETANTVWAGPTSGGAVVPTFRALVCSDLPAGNCPFDIVMFWPGVPPNSTIIRVAITRAVSCVSGFTGSVGIAREGATAQTVVNVNQITSGVTTTRGSATFAASGGANQAATFASSGGMTLAANDQVEFAFPGTADATLGDVAITLKCSRT